MSGLTLFLAELFNQGLLSVPVFLLKNYRHLNLTEKELVFLLQLMSFNNEGNLLPSAEFLGKSLGEDLAEIKKNYRELIKKGIISVSKKFDEKSGKYVETIDYTPLLEKLTDLWAAQKVLNEVNNRPLEKVSKDSAARVVEVFSREFGRGLSPMEIELIDNWLNHKKYSEELIFEALKRAVILNKKSFRYIDAILYRWESNNIKTIEEVNNFEEQMKKKKAAKTSKNENNDRDAKKKELIKKLYLS
ncbi:DNA replication protein DnaD [Carboxydothermus islandicus]|uniref:DNA replication protein DnaD n=1 Tax=Carboxydothermus islandicus TaxID=661089 RepID=A0A1L8D0M0_9THEO|nr:DnaD domain protein [Carboxydothermus islandicus]GAV24708.1 DNA replication protein DnaD [Carboxydothermus islandicus]